MAASNSPRLSSPSESDSDREPNSHGARVFWGNLKTPEKSRSVFVDPPQTVVKTQRTLHIQSTQTSTEFFTSLQDISRSSQDFLQMVEECDEPLDPAHPSNEVMTKDSQAQEQYDVTHPHFQESCNDGDDAGLLDTLAVSPQPDTTVMHSPDSGSEGEIERDPALQPSSPGNMLSPPVLFAQEPSDTVCERAAPITVPPHTDAAMSVEPRGPRASELPDLISFDVQTPPRTSFPEFQSSISSQSSLTPPSQLSSSSATVDDLLTLSPTQSKSPLLQPRVLEAQPNDLDQEVVVTPSLSAPEHEISYQKDASTGIGACLSEIAVDTDLVPIQTASLTSSEGLVRDTFVAACLSEPEAKIAVESDSAPIQTTPLMTPLPSATETPLQLDATTSNNGDICTAPQSTGEDGPTTTDLIVVDAAASHTSQQVVISLPSTFRGETRKRSPAKGSKGKEKAHVGDNSGNESSNNTSSESPPPANDDECASDKAAKKERRAKAKREAEHRRQQLVSLSPTSANVLSILASPDRNTPIRPIGLDEAVSDFARNSDPDLPHSSTSAEPGTPGRNAATRVPIPASSPRRSVGSPLSFIAPGPVNLNDPNRTPARRILLPPGSQTPRPLPLDDPNRTPARRVSIHPSPSRPAEPTDIPVAPIRIKQSSPIKEAMLSPAKSSTQPTLSKPNDKTTSLSSSLSSAIGVSRPLPFPIRQTVLGDTTTVTSLINSRPKIDSGIAKLQPASNLRQSSSISSSKIARITTKPYSRTAQRSLVTSFMRGPSPTAGASSASTTSAGPSRTHPSPPNLPPSRIPSPSKRPAHFVKPVDPSTTTPALASANVNNAEDKVHGTNVYKRKRQRMISEGDPDEPPAKRAVIMVRPVIKGMYNKSSANPNASESTINQREASPVPPARPPGPIKVRPVIPGTLRHFETTRSSSRDLFNNSEQDNNSDTQFTVTDPSDSGMEAPESREETPLDTDTVSTVTTLSREPTLEELLDISAPHSETPLDTDTASTVTTLSREPTLEELLDISAPHSETPLSTESAPELRRTTRVRKPYGPDALGIATNSRAALRRDPMPLSRTTSMVQGEGALCPKASSRSTTRMGAPQEGLSLNPRQLQALTDANTLRNQICLAELERKVVRRYGPRPASPSTKVRTIMEKSREDRSKGREERAERRRRREQGSNMSASSEGDYIDAPSSPTPEKRRSENGLFTKHVRGPGDEEDYETPKRPPMTSQVDPSKPAKTVKWDRGLARTISDWDAEQVAKKAREEAAAEDIRRKGCLVYDRATLHLDPLGNVPDANEPVEDLGRERIIVTRFVYDDDVEATRIARRKKG